jgi:basic amino acid/polyamine antiporter, APA family
MTGTTIVLAVATLAIVAALLVRARRQGRSAAGARKGGAGGEYASILVAFDARSYVGDVVGTALKLAVGRAHGIHVLVTVEVPRSAEIDSDRVPGEAEALAIIERARLQGGRLITGSVERVRAGQAGRCVVDLARRLQVDAIVMAAAPRGDRGTGVYGRTVETVLEERPCRVIVESPPATAEARP